MTRTEELHAALRLADWEGAYTVRTLMADTLQAERDEAVALLRDIVEPKLFGEPGHRDFNATIAAVRAFLTKVSNG